jgi:hypothetical protein
MPDSWSNIEVEVIVADYFSMLIEELTGKTLNKTVHRRNLLPLLKNRSEGSIEFKHQNISAILIRFGQPYIRGYLPRYNYQGILEEKVIEYLTANPDLERQFQQFIEKGIAMPMKMIDYSNILVDPPKVELNISEPISQYKKNPIKVNYLEREQSNRKLGAFGEQVVIQYEKWQLINLGKEKLAEQIEWVSKDLSDGAGFDILSKNPNGSDKYIEVKTTRLGKETPFFFSSNELDFSTKKSNDYHLFRLFNADSNLKIFKKNGPLNEICNFTPIQFKGYF